MKLSKKVFRDFKSKPSCNDIELHSLVQLVRLSDVLLVGPAMLIGAKTSSMPKEFRTLLAFMGLTTIVFNALNFTRIELTGKTV